MIYARTFEKFWLVFILSLLSRRTITQKFLSLNEAKSVLFATRVLFSSFCAEIEVLKKK